MFWLPEVLQWATRNDMTTTGWKVAFGLLPVVLAYVANQLPMFDWPTAETVTYQYKRLMTAWAQLMTDASLRATFFSCSATEPGETFSWKAWWKASHTDRRFLPAGLEAAFALYHFTGMMGLSEASAESIASLLKRYSPKAASRLGTDRIIEKTMLRVAGVAGDGSDDLLLLRAWADFFGGLEPDRFSFDRICSTRSSKHFPLGHGSIVLHHVLKRSQRMLRWRSAHGLARLPRASGDGVVPRAVKPWLKRLHRAP